jgi:hypothetical protein
LLRYWANKATNLFGQLSPILTLPDPSLGGMRKIKHRAQAFGTRYLFAGSNPSVPI